MNNEISSLYQEIIIDHSQSPHNFKIMNDSDLHKKGFNPLCGDQLTIYLKTKGNIIDDISFTGSGCAISIASASLMTDLVLNKSFNEVLDLFKNFKTLTTTGACQNLNSLGKLIALSSISKFPMRVKCATLAWHTLKQLIKNGKN